MPQVALVGTPRLAFTVELLPCARAAVPEAMTWSENVQLPCAQLARLVGTLVALTTVQVGTTWLLTTVAALRLIELQPLGVTKLPEEQVATPPGKVMLPSRQSCTRARCRTHPKARPSGWRKGVALIAGYTRW